MEPTVAAVNAWIDALSPRFPLRAFLLRKAARRPFLLRCVLRAAARREGVTGGVR